MHEGEDGVYTKSVNLLGSDLQKEALENENLK